MHSNSSLIEDRGILHALQTLQNMTWCNINEHSPCGLTTQIECTYLICVYKFNLVQVSSFLNWVNDMFVKEHEVKLAL